VATTYDWPWWLALICQTMVPLVAVVIAYRFGRKQATAEAEKGHKRARVLEWKNGNTLRNLLNGARDGNT